MARGHCHELVGPAECGQCPVDCAPRGISRAWIEWGFLNDPSRRKTSGEARSHSLSLRWGFAPSDTAAEDTAMHISRNALLAVALTALTGVAAAAPAQSAAPASSPAAGVASARHHHKKHHHKHRRTGSTSAAAPAHS